MKRRKNSAFTLVELLVVISILTLLLIMIAACGVGGYLVYDHVSEDNTEQVDT